VFLVAVLMGLGTVAGHIPVAVLAGILIAVGISIVDSRGLRSLAVIPRADAGVMVRVLSLTVFVDLLWAVAAGVAVSAMVFIRETAILVEDRSEVLSLRADHAWPDEAQVSPELLDRIYIKHLDGPIFFGFASRLVEMVESLPRVQMVVIRMNRVPYIDHSGVVALEASILRMTELNVDVVITGLTEQPGDLMRAMKIIGGLVPEGHIFTSFEEARVWMIARLPSGVSVLHLLEGRTA
jgi:SulP family sulfate permease